MTTSLKQRMIGAIFILSLGVILIPLILDEPKENVEAVSYVMPEEPALPDVSEVSKIHYVFDTHSDAPVPAAAEVIAAAETADIAEAQIKIDPPVPPMVSEVTSAPEPGKTTQTQQKAKETLAQAAQAQWTIQLGAFSSEKNANALMKKLSAQGFNPYLRKMANDSLVRVYVSPGVPRDQAVSVATKLDTELGLKGIVVRYFQ